MKRLSQRLWLLCLLVAFTLPSFAVKQALFEDFTTANASTLPTGWTRENATCWKLGGQNSYVYYSTTTKLATYRGKALVSPMVDISALDYKPVLRFRMWQMVTQNVCDTLVVGYITATGGEETILDTISDTSLNGVPQEYIYELPAGLNQIQLYFHGYSAVAGGFYIDYVALENTSKCTQEIKNLQAEKEYLTVNSALISWSPATTGAFVGYDVKVASNELTQKQLSDNEVADVLNKTDYNSEELEVSGLKSNTTYYVYVRTDCGEGEESKWASISFVTPCALSKPTDIVLDFETDLSECYSAFIQKRYLSAAATLSKAEIAKTTALSGSQAFYFYAQKDVDSYLFFPALEFESGKSIKDYQVSFKARGNSASYRTIYVGVADAHSPSAITQLQKIDLPANTTNYDITVPFADYEGAGSSVVIYALGDGGSHMVYIDDVKIEEYAGCTTPFFASVSKFGADFADIAWNGTEKGKYNIVFATKELTVEALNEVTPSTDGVSIMAVNVEGLTYSTGTKLTPGTTYQVYIQGACGTAWTQTSFTTNYRMTIPFAEPFNTASGYADADFVTANYTATPSDFKMKIGARTSADAVQPFSTTYKEYLVTTQNHTTPADPQKDGSLYMKSGTAGYVYMILPELPSDVTVQEVALKFYLYSSAAASATAMTGKLLVGVSDKADVTLATGEFMNKSLQIIDTISATAAKTWEEKNVYFRRYTKEGKYIVILTPNVATEYYIDDISIDYAPACLPVRNLKATAKDADQLLISWEEQSIASSWNLKVSSTEITDFSQTADITDRTVATKEFMQGNLQPGQTVYIYVKPAGCDVEWQSATGTTRYAIDGEAGWYNDFPESKYTSGTTNPPYDMFVGNCISTPTTTNIAYVYPTAWNKSYYPGSECTPYSIKFGSSAGSKGAYLVLPKVINADVKDLNVTFWLYYENNTTNNTGNFYVGVVDDPLNVKLDDITEVAIEEQFYRTASFHTVSMKEYKGNGKYIILYVPIATGSSAAFYIDNLSVISATQPQQVTSVNATATTENSLTLDWSENGIASMWDVKLFTKATADPNQETPVKNFTATTDKPLTVTGLTESTLYYVYVRSNQGAKGTGAWSDALKVYTDCAIKALPWTYDFNFIEPFTAAQLATQTSLPPCMSIGNKDATAKYPPFVEKSHTNQSDTYIYYRDHTYNDQYGSADYNFLRFSSGGSDMIPYLILPEFEGDIKDLQLRFYGAWGDYYGNQSGSSYGGIAEIGVYEGDDENGKPIFTYVDQFRTVERNWNEGLFYFNNYTGTGKRIAIVVDVPKFLADNNLTSKSLSLNIDDIEVKKAPVCHRVSDIYTTALDSIGATIAWTKAKDETEWNIKVSTKAIDAATTTQDLVLNTTATTPSVALTGLTEATEYYVYVQSKKGSETGEWSKAFVFKTLWNALPLPYSEDFESYSANAVPDKYYHYLGSDATDDTQIAKAFFVSAIGTTGTAPRAAVEGSKFHFNIKNSTKDNVDYFVMPAFKLEDGSLADVRDLQITFKLTSNTTYYTPVTVGVMSDPTKVSTFVAIATDTTEYSAQPPVWKDFYHDFKNFKGGEDPNQAISDFKYIAFRVGNRISNKTSLTEAVGNVFLDNIEIDKYTPCPKPAQLAVSDLTNSTATISWQTNLHDPAINKDEVVYNVRIFDAMPQSATENGYVSQTSVTGELSASIEGLQGNTVYYAFVSADCSSELNSGWSDALTFRTECNPALSLPALETFEGYGTDIKIPYCWTAANSPVFKRNSDLYNYAASGTTGMSLPKTSSATSPNVLITPKLDVEKLSDLVVYFKAAATSQANLKLNIYAISEAEYGTSQTAAKELITTVDIPYYYTGKNYTFTPYIVSLDSYTTTNDYKYLGFEAENGEVIIDDIYLVSNPADATLPVLDLRLKDKADTWVTYQFIDFDLNKNNWDVEYGQKGFEQGTGTLTKATATVDTLKNLTANTEYDLYIRRSEASEWQKLTFKTAPTAAVLPESFTDNFSDLSLWTRQQGKNRDNDNINKQYVWYWRLLEVKESDNYNYVVQADLKKFTTTQDEPTINDSAVISMAIVPAYYEYINGNDAGQYTRFPLAVTPSGVVPAVGSTTTFFEGTSTLNANEVLNEFAIFKFGYGLNSGVEKPDTSFTKIVNLNPGLYKILYRYYNKQGVSETLPEMLKAVSLSEYNCVQPTGVKVEELKDTEATFSWQAGKSENFEVVVAGSGYNNPFALAEDQMYFHQVVEGKKTVTVTGLESGKNYSFYVRTMCLAEYTDFAEFTFKTLCPQQELPLVEEFNSYPDCWLLLNETPGLETSYNKNYTHIETLSQYNDENEEIGSFSVLALQTGSILALPPTGQTVDNLRIELSIHSSVTSYNSELELGLFDPRDNNSFTTLATFTTTENRNTLAKTPYHFDKFVFRGRGLENVENKVFAVRTVGATSESYSSFPTYIDYIKLTKLPEWLEPEDLKVLDVTSSSVTLTWTAAADELSWKVKVGDKEYEASEVPFTVTGLEPDSIYQAQVAAVYATAVSDYTEPVEFMTGCGVYSAPYIQDFSKNKSTGSSAAINLTCWDNYISTMPIDSVFKGLTLPQTPADYLANTALWYLNSSFGQKHAASTEGTAGYRWLISPNVIVEDNTSLSFLLARSKESKCLTEFYVAISTDGGESWKEEDAIKYQMLTFDVTDFTEPQIVDLSKYVGKTIRVAFYHGVKEAQSSPCILHLGNIRFNCIEKIQATDIACEQIDYEGEYFTVKKENLVVGDTILSRFAWSNTECDSLITVNLTVNPTEYETYQATTCPGMTVTFDGQEYELPEGETYIEHLIRTYTDEGCYKVITLQISKDDNCATTSLDEAESSLQLLPNVAAPAQVLTLTGNTDNIASAQVYDARGAFVMKLTDVSFAAPQTQGIYMLRITLKSGKTITERFVVK